MEFFLMMLGNAAVMCAMGFLLWVGLDGPTNKAKQVRLAHEAERDTELAKLERARLEARRQ